MECIIAYLLLAVFIDLALEIARMDCTEDEAQWVKRSLWGQTPFDCGTRAVGAMATVPRQHAEWKKNRFRVEQGRGDVASRLAKPPVEREKISLFPNRTIKTRWIDGNRWEPVNL